MRKHQPIWDSAALTTTGVLLTFFQTQLGAGSSVWNASGAKTLEDTNMRAAGQLPKPWAMTVKTIQLQTAPDAPVLDLQKIFKGGALEFSINGVVVYELPPIFASAGAGVYASWGTMTAAAGNSNGSIGVPDRRNVWALQEPIVLHYGVTFGATIKWGTTPSVSATTGVRCLLDGIQETEPAPAA